MAVPAASSVRTSSAGGTGSGVGVGVGVGVGSGVSTGVVGAEVFGGLGTPGSPGR